MSQGKFSEIRIVTRNLEGIPSLRNHCTLRSYGRSRAGQLDWSVAGRRMTPGRYLRVYRERAGWSQSETRPPPRRTAATTQLTHGARRAEEMHPPSPRLSPEGERSFVRVPRRRSTSRRQSVQKTCAARNNRRLRVRSAHTWRRNETTRHCSFRRGRSSAARSARPAGPSGPAASLFGPSRTRGPHILSHWRKPGRRDRHRSGRRIVALHRGLARRPNGRIGEREGQLPPTFLPD